MIKLFKKTDDYQTHGRILGWGSGPDADWRVMFSSFLILALVASILGGLLFYHVWNANFGTDFGGETESPLDKNLLKRTVNSYKAKQEAFDTLKTSKEMTPDPSK